MRGERGEGGRGGLGRGGLVVWCEGSEEGLKIFRWYYTQENNKKPRQTTSLIIRPILSQTSSCVCIYLTLYFCHPCPNTNPPVHHPNPHRALLPPFFLRLTSALKDSLISRSSSSSLKSAPDFFHVVKKCALICLSSPARPASPQVALRRKRGVDVRTDSRRDCEGRRRARRIRGRESSMGGGRASERRMLQTSTDG